MRSTATAAMSEGIKTQSGLCLPDEMLDHVSAISGSLHYFLKCRGVGSGMIGQIDPKEYNLERLHSPYI